MNGYVGQKWMDRSMDGQRTYHRWTDEQIDIITVCSEAIGTK